jgi:hypothetical protein
MSALEVARDHARTRSRLAEVLRLEARQAWSRVDPAHISETWAAQIPRLLLLLSGGQHAAAASADRYVTEVLVEQGINPATEGRLDAASLSRIASDGRPLESLLAQPGVTAKVALAGGETLERAMTAGNALAQLIAHTQVADAGRVADQVALTSRRNSAGYVRMLVGKSCSRCIVLAGKFYRWNAGFRRHPKCDCVHIPAAENDPNDMRVNPKKTFESMSAAEQDQVFTKAGAQAIRDGGDINQVVNARRGASGLAPAGARLTAAELKLLRGGRDVGRLEAVDVFGRPLFVTSEGTTARGMAGVRLGAKVDGVKTGKARYRSAKPPRLMPESIYQISGGNRDEALRLLKRFGYIL